jgi:hypothetical protein
MTAAALLPGLAGLWFAAVLLVLLANRATLRRLWREPVLRRPLLVIESDDWGAGPLSQAAALHDIAAILQNHRDADGRPARITLALVLAVPDGAAIDRDGRYHRLRLDDPRFAPLAEALKEGRRQGVFALQLHGLEHYWPATLASSRQPAVARWLRQHEPAATEELPAALQSRWIDASVLPSAPLHRADIESAVAEEVRSYAEVVGEPPAIVVPPTFVWTREVESAWAAQGIGCIVTPGWRYTSRDGTGAPTGDEGPIANGDRAQGITYLARSDYFEPHRGRGAAHALAVLRQCVHEGRACLLENHRDNFVGEPGRSQRSCAELDRLLREAKSAHPGLRWLSTAELLEVLHTRDPAWLVDAWRERLPYLWRRLGSSGRPWKLLRLAGAAWLGGQLVRALGVQAGTNGRRT